MKRFWINVALDEGRAVSLDGKPVRTPGRVPLALPTEALAEAVAGEWRAVEGEIDPRAMPLTGLANAAIDRVGADPALFARGLAVYAESDLLCYRADAPDDLVARQQAAWDPLLDWARARYDVHLETATGILHRAQPAATLTRLSEAIATRDAFALAALSPIVTIGGSLIAALALAENAATPEQVWDAITLDEDYQAERWGRDPLAAAGIEARRRDFDAGVRMLELLER
ncbi:ATP12 family chaperone protein [Sphingomonas sp. HMP6]|uniref:ATP12 family chaperone protein n=1 Tax=Sphingomonas sp. HMP6 TaxID=1517551 RepID=UPI0015970FFB|nr:ATP12 family protein [Sphingomonas sp. HMP6]BCA60514.1 ATPase [Sphingomonas sp. HMP6]